MLDYHLHTLLSPDGKSTLTEYCLQAQLIGCTELCVTDHMDIGYSKSEYEGVRDVSLSYQEVLKAREAFPALNIKLGIEAGYKSESQHETAMLLAGVPFDYIINSIHEIQNHDPYYPSYFDNKTRNEAYLGYLEAVFESLDACYDFSVIGHIGYVTRYAPYPHAVLEPAEFPDLLDAILMRIIYTGKGIEVNTSTLKKCGFTMPSAALLRRYKELGGELITIGSDAHQAKDLCSGFTETKDLLKSIGFQYITRYQQLKPLQMPID